MVPPIGSIGGTFRIVCFGVSTRLLGAIDAFALGYLFCQS